MIREGFVSSGFPLLLQTTTEEEGAECGAGAPRSAHHRLAFELRYRNIEKKVTPQREGSRRSIPQKEKNKDEVRMPQGRRDRQGWGVGDPLVEDGGDGGLARVLVPLRSKQGARSGMWCSRFA